MSAAEWFVMVTALEQSGEAEVSEVFEFASWRDALPFAEAYGAREASVDIVDYAGRVLWRNDGTVGPCGFTSAPLCGGMYAWTEQSGCSRLAPVAPPPACGKHPVDNYTLSRLEGDGEGGGPL